MKKKKVEEQVNVLGYGKVYIEYEHIEDAKTAQRALSGRRYDGRMVITSFHPEEKWKTRTLEPDPLVLDESHYYAAQQQYQQQLQQQSMDDYEYYSNYS